MNKHPEEDTVPETLIALFIGYWLSVGILTGIGWLVQEAFKILTHPLS